MVRLNIAGTPQLCLQLREGAQADVFVSADRQSYIDLLDTADKHNSTSQSHAPTALTSNKMVVAVPNNNPLGIQSLSDLGDGSLQLILAGPDVPAGRYARQILTEADVDVHSVSDEPSVRSCLQKLALGEVDATLAYASDLHSFQGRLQSIPIDVQFQVPVESVIGVWPASHRPDLAEQFVAFALGPQGSAILASHGFLAPAE